jgi:hypothetical protein
MTTVNAVGVSLSGQTGTGSFAGSTSPSFTTPTLGVSTATSINFGGSALSNYITTTSWPPVFTFSTPGDLSVVYTTQTGRYARIGNIVIATFNLTFTPTYTTASSTALITGLTLAPAISTVGYCYTSAPSYPAGTTSPLILIAGGATNIQIAASGSGATAANLTVANITSGAACTIIGSIMYAI